MGEPRSLKVTINPDEYYTFDEVVALCAEEFGITALEATVMVHLAELSGELRSVAVDDLKAKNKVN